MDIQFNKIRQIQQQARADGEAHLAQSVAASLAQIETILDRHASNNEDVAAVFEFDPGVTCHWDEAVVKAVAEKICNPQDPANKAFAQVASLPVDVQGYATIAGKKVHVGVGTRSIPVLLVAATEEELNRLARPAIREKALVRYPVGWFDGPSID